MIRLIFRSWALTAALTLLLLPCIASAQDAPTEFESVQDGAWADPETWGYSKESGITPGEGSTVTVKHVLRNPAGTCQTVVIEEGATLTNAGAGSSLRVAGDLTNYGTVSADPSDPRLTIYIGGNLMTVGRWAPAQTRFEGDAVHAVSHTALYPIEGHVYAQEGRVRAASDLHFKHPTDFSGATLEMHSRRLTVSHVTGGTITGATRIDADGEARLAAANVMLTIAGTETEFVGDFNPGNLHLDTRAVIQGRMRNAGSGGIRFLGDVINNGTIEADVADPRLTVYLAGDLTNDGIWAPTQTRFAGATDQTIMHAAGKALAGAMYNEKPGGRLIAGSDLALAGNLDMNDNVLETGGHALRMAGGSIFDAVIEGDTELFGLWTGTHISFGGDIVLRDTISNRYGRSQTVIFKASFINEGVIASHPDDDRLTIVVNGDLTNNGTWRPWATEIDGDGPRTISGANIEGHFWMRDRYATADGIILVGDNVLPGFDLGYQVRVTVAPGATAYLYDGYLRGSLTTFENHGKITQPRAVDAAWTEDFHLSRVWLAELQQFDSLIVESYGHQTVPSFPNAASQWWRFRPVPDTVSVPIKELTLRFTPEMMAEFSTTDVQVWHSLDSARTWTQLSTASNVMRTTSSIVLKSAPAAGDYALSESEPAAVSSEYEPEVAPAFGLEQNYPNPFSTSTRIGFSLMEAGHVRLIVHDLLGREVTVLVDGMVPAGQHTVTVDARSLPSGPYFYRYEAGDRRLSRKMLLIR